MSVLTSIDGYNHVRIRVSGSGCSYLDVASVLIQMLARF
jgi:hypothetical protein